MSANIANHANYFLKNIREIRTIRGIRVPGRMSDLFKLLLTNTIPVRREENIIV